MKMSPFFLKHATTLRKGIVQLACIFSVGIRSSMSLRRGLMFHVVQKIEPETTNRGPMLVRSWHPSISSPWGIFRNSTQNLPEKNRNLQAKLLENLKIWQSAQARAGSGQT